MFSSSSLYPEMPEQKRMPSRTLLISAIVLLSVGIIWLGTDLSWKRGLRDLHASNRQQLDQFIGHLDARLSRFEFTPQLIAKNRMLDEFLVDPKNINLKETVNRFLEDINDVIGASDSYLMDKNGLTIAASNWQSERPFVGRNFAFRPYFSAAMKGSQGRYFALGSTSEKRGYYFSYPVTDTAGQIGVVVIKMDLSNIEQHWSGRDIQFIVSDDNGVVFITTQPDWLFHSLRSLDEQTLTNIRLGQQYLNIDIKPLQIEVESDYSEHSQLLRFGSERKAAQQHFLTLQQDMPSAGWSVTILAPLDDVKKNSITTAIILLLLITLAVLIAFIGKVRHKRHQERERFQLEAQKQLEQQVSLRTADLSREVEQHKQTEKTLRDTQGELIQTAKLAVLGEMSASISHELNNPLAAIRSYADNARQFLSLNKDQQVDENLGRIAGLTEQMAKISSQLKFFARKSSGNLEAVNVHTVIQSAIDLVSPQYKKTSITIESMQNSDELMARADIIHLEQVVINLINNAMNAMENVGQGQIRISTQKDRGSIIINVDDTGPGINTNNLDKIFDPFFTTRKAGLGLGLSISARIIDNMQGSLSAQNLAQGGARFTITLQADKTSK